jgi:hypothetical protein
VILKWYQNDNYNIVVILIIMMSIPYNWDQTHDLYPPIAKPQAPQTCIYKKVSKNQYTIQQFLTPLIGGQKLKFWVEIFKIDARIAYVILIKKFNFLFFWNLYGISKVAFVECEWLIFKLHVGLDNDPYWIWASLAK